jgi:hypothetical protein
MDREHRHDLVPVENLPLFVAQQTPIAIAIMRDAHPRRVCADRGTQRLRPFAANACIDVLPVRGGPKTNDLGTQSAQDNRTCAAG